MPHDAHGKKLKVGDRVLMAFEVKAVHEQENACNVDLEAFDPLNAGEYRPVLTCNGRLTSRLDLNMNASVVSSGSAR